MLKISNNVKQEDIKEMRGNYRKNICSLKI